MYPSMNFQTPSTLHSWGHACFARTVMVREHRTDVSTEGMLNSMMSPCGQENDLKVSGSSFSP